MSRFNLNVFTRFWAIAKLYWLGNEKKGGLALLVLLAVLLGSYTAFDVLFNNKFSETISALSEKNPERFWQTIIILLVVIVIYVPLIAGFYYCRNRLSNYWRRWLTNEFITRYFQNRAYYNLNQSSTAIDNPDQRISEDIKTFTKEALTFILDIILSLCQAVAFSIILWFISPTLVIFILIYAIGGTLITVGFFGKKLVKLNFAQLKKEADFRFGLIRIRENVESIAFYQGEEQESTHVSGLFNAVFRNYNRLILWQDLNLGLFSNAYRFITFIIPVVIVGIRVLDGELEVGKVVEARGAFFSVFTSLNLIVSRFEYLTSFVAGIDRLHFLHEYLEEQNSKNLKLDPTRPTIYRVQQDRLAIDNLTLQTPNYQRVLIRDLSLELHPKDSLLIMGASGGGKSSLLRAIAGLWNSGTGSITRPSLDKILFLPQKPYTILGDLRSQIIYPHANLNISDEALYTALKQVNLPDLAERFGGLEVERDWSDVLSLGEQQRLAFARILINRPEYIILDEATSALDVTNEAFLYHHLQQLNATFISVGHRPTLIQYHRKVLRILDEQDWIIEDTSKML